MLILGLDLARHAGWAIGEPKDRPESGSWDLRERGIDMYDEPAALARNLSMLVERYGVPALIAVEEPLEARAKWQMAGRDGRAYAHSTSLKAQHMAHGALYAWAGVSRIDVLRVAANSARKALCGKASAGGRDETKEMVRRTLVMIGHLPSNCTDLDRSDAVCIWNYAAATKGRSPAALVLS